MNFPVIICTSIQRARPTFNLLAAVLFCFVAFGASAQSVELPPQMIYLPLGGDPIGSVESSPLQLIAYFMELSDDRSASLYRLSWWSRVGRSHAARLTIDYAGVEGGDQIRYGGGRTEARWTSRIGSVEGRGFALDLVGNLPTGDEGLFPLSAKAPTLEARLRWSALRVASWRFWCGYWGRQASPPSASVRQDPLVGFPSGSGFDILVEGRIPGAHLELIGRLPQGGQIFEFTWVQVNFDWHVSSDLRLRTGAAIAFSEVDQRPIDHSFQVGAVWLPPSSEETKLEEK